MSTYVDPWGGTVSRATVTVSEEVRSARVTYRGEAGTRFSVIVRQKPNAIGFGARLPGDAVDGSTKSVHTRPR